MSGAEPGPGPSGPLEALRAELEAEGSVLSANLAAPGAAEAAAPLGELVAASPRVAPDGDAYAVVIECVREGYLLHYGTARIISPPDAELALLAGDYLYAKALERLAARGDLDSIRELADLISLSAQLHAEVAPAEAESAAAALWLASAVAIATGPDPAHERAKEGLRDRGDTDPLAGAARDTAARAGLDEQFARAAEAVGFRPPDRG